MPAVPADRDPIARVPRPDTWAGRRDPAGHLVARNPGILDAVGAVQDRAVAAAETAGCDLNQHFVRTRLRSLALLHRQGAGL